MLLYWNESLHKGAPTQNFCMALCTIVLRIKAFVQQAPCTTSPGLPYPNYKMLLVLSVSAVISLSSKSLKTVPQ